MESRLNGTWELDFKGSESPDEVMGLMGMGFVKRKTISNLNMIEKYKVAEKDVPPEVLAKCPEVPQFQWDTPFQKDLIEHLHSYFERIKAPGQTIRQASKVSWARALLLFTFFMIRNVIWYLHFTMFSWWTLILVPIAEWVYSSNVFHDASHSSMVVSPWGNHLLQHVTFFTTSPSLWFVQHIIAHHPYTNMKGYDPDLGRPHSHEMIVQGKKPYNSFSLFIYWILAMPVIAWVMDPEAWTVKFYNSIVPVLLSPFNGYFIHTLGRMTLFFFWCGWAFFFTPSLTHAIIWSTLPIIIYSVCFMFCTQLTHMNEISMANANHDTQDWYVHQVTTAVNHSIGNKFWTLWTGSLNYQIEHHIYPTVNHCHLPNLQPGVKAICEKHGVAYAIKPVSECLLTYFDLVVGL